MKEKLLKIESTILRLPQTFREYFYDLIEHFKVIREKLKDLAKTNYELGLFHLENGNLADAKMRFIFALKLKGELAPAHYHLARCHLFNLAFDKAKHELETAIALDPSLSLAKYRLKLLNSTVADDLIPIAVIREDYNTSANNYEEYMLNRLNYNAPEYLAKALASSIKQEMVGQEELNCLDLGCGTGLAGACLAEQVTIKSLLGIDISVKMLELAKTLEIKGNPVYTEVKESDFCNLELLKGEFNIIIACMSFGYANDLASIFKGLNRLSLEGSILGLVVLKSEAKEIEFNYEHACFSFSKKFLENIFQETSWSIKQQEEIALFNNGAKGLMFILKKMSN